MPSSPLGVFNFSKKGEAAEPPGTGSCSMVADKVLLYKNANTVLQNPALVEP